MSERISALLERATLLEDENGISRRREELVRRATDAGHSREYADQIYDVATEEGVDPAAAFELVLTGVGVRDLAPPAGEQREEAQVEAPPAWVSEHAPQGDEATRERNMRQSFRRLRSIMERVPSAREALQEFVRAPDVGDVDF